MVDGVKPEGLSIDVTLSSGDKKSYTIGEANALGLDPLNPEDANKKRYYYQDSNGNDVYTHNIEDLPMSAELNKETGDIVITAPKSIYDTDEFKKIFNEDILKSYSQAYKLNPDYKVPVTEKNEETGKEEEKQVTIPEWVNKLNEDFLVYQNNLKSVRKYRESLRDEFGDKVDNLTNSHMGIIMQNPSSGVYIPDVLFNVNYFGDDPNIGNPFKELKGKAGANGSYTVDQLKEIYTRGNFGRTELAGVIATINGQLEGSNWDKEDTYKDADGNEVKNRNSATEAAKLIAFREYLKANHPESEWYQQVGDNIETLTYNTGYYASRVWANAINVVQMPSGATTAYDWIKKTDNTMEYYNTLSQMETDAAAAMQVMGMLGGTVAGSYTVGLAVKAGVNAVLAVPRLAAAAGATKASAAGAKAIESAVEALGMGEAAQKALTAKTVLSIIKNSKEISLGAKIAIRAWPMAQKVLMAESIARNFLEVHKTIGFITSFLFDTVHDALLFDSTTLRDTLEATDEETRSYWMGQLADNAKWWAGMSLAKGMIKFSGKTVIGKTLDAYITPYINKKLAIWGDRKAKFYDNVAGGSLVKKLEDSLDNMQYGSQRWNRTVRKIQQLEFDEIVRTARRELGDIKIDTRFGIPTKEGFEQLRIAKNNVKAIENAIDAYGRNVNVTVNRMISPQYDPATGRMRYINPELAQANSVVSDYYYSLVRLGKKYGLPVAERSLLNQDVIDYFVGSYHLRIMERVSKYGNSDNARLAKENIPIIQKNLEALKAKLPEEIINKINDGINGRIYQNWYRAQNEYGKSMGLLDRAKINSYDSNIIWAADGYMPANILTDPTGRFRRNDGKVEAVISQDIEHFTYKVSRGQHYADPEVTRFNKLRALAKAEVNADIIKAYNNLSTSANVVKISGKDTEYARRINDNRKTLENLLASSAKNQFVPGEFEFKLSSKSNGEVKINVYVDLGTRSAIIASMSPEDVAYFLNNRGVIKGKNGKISDNVNAENYNEWFEKQSKPVQNYLLQKFTEMTGDDVVSRSMFDQLGESHQTLIRNGIDDIKNATSLEEKAAAVFRGRQLMNAYGENNTLEMAGLVRQTEKEMSEAGYSIADFNGKAHSGADDAYDVVRVDGPETDNMIVTSTIEPAIYKDGKLVRKAKVVVGDEKLLGTNGIISDAMGGPTPDGLEFFDAVPGTYEHKQMVGLIDGKKDIEYYAKAHDQRVAFVYMSPDEYLEALMKKNGGPYENIDEILGRSRERWTTKDGKKTGWMDYADQMRSHDFDPNAGDGKFPPPRLIYDKEGYLAQEGIHRALAARYLGVKEIPVSVQYSDRNIGENVSKLLDGKKSVLPDDDAEGLLTHYTNEYGITDPRKIKTAPKYTKDKILDGSYTPRTRYELAKTAAAEYPWYNEGSNGIVLYGEQKNGVGSLDAPRDVEVSLNYNGTEPFKISGANQLSGVPLYDTIQDSLAAKKAANVVFFPVSADDILYSHTIRSMQKFASELLSIKPEERTLDNLMKMAENKNGFTYIGGNGSVVPPEDAEDVIKKILSLDDATIRKIADGDARTLLDFYDKKVLQVFESLNSDARYAGRRYVFFQDRNPELFENGIDAMSNVKNDTKNLHTVSYSTYMKYKESKIRDLVQSKPNVDFLEKLGWNRYAVWTSAEHPGDYGWYRPSWDKIWVNYKNINTLEELMSVEMHEISHALWHRASDATRKAVGQDLINLLGLKINVDDRVVASEAMNELIAHAMETRFQSKRGWDLLKNDSVTKEHITTLAKAAGYTPTESFKTRVMVTIRSLVTYIKSKMLGINSARTFDEFFYGLLRGEYAEDFKNLKPVTGLYNKLEPKWGLQPYLDVPGHNRKVDINDLTGDPIDIDVKINGVSTGGSGGGGGVDGGGSIDDIPLRIPVSQQDSAGEIISINRPASSTVANSYELFKKAVDKGGVDFEDGLQRAYLIGDEKLAETPMMNEAARNLENGKDAFYQGVLAAKIKGEFKNRLPYDTDKFVDDIYTSIRKHINDYVDKIVKNKGAREVIFALAEDANGAEAFARYYALKGLSETKNLNKAKDTMAKAVWEELKGKDVSIGDGEAIKKMVKQMVGETVDTELDAAANAAKTINPELVDTKDIFKKVERLNNKIQGIQGDIKTGSSNYVMYLDDQGREVYAQVSPAFASLYNYRYQIENADATAMAKLNAMMSRMFRYGTTSVNLSSFGNQLFRDFGNAIMVGGSWQTIKTNSQNLVDVFGQQIIDEINRFDPSGYEMRQVEKIAKDSGQTLQQAAVSRELMKGSALAPTTTETTLYARFMKEAYGKDPDSLIKGMKQDIDSLLEKYNPDKILNGKRETYLRRRVYTSALNDALKEGYNLEQARTYAEFAMNNATTNFARQLYHLQAIADSTPYFRAAINGSKSFWRMWSLDPIGITGRITGGLIIPTMALTAYSLADKDSAEIYKNIPEYQKDSSLVFVFDGKAMSIPIPQEISNIVNPFRHFVEYLHQAQPNTFQELAMNDLLGFVPYDLTGFSTVDMDHMAEDPTFFDRVSRGFARIFSTMAPVPVKSVYMLATGTDPYSGKSLRDPKNNVYWNSETGTTEVMDYNQNALARVFAEVFGDYGMSSNLAEKILSGIFGSTGSNLLGDITALFTEGGESALASAANNIGEQIMKPYDVPVYNLADSTWKREIRALTMEKEAILNSKKMVTLNNKLSQTTDPTERKKILAERSNMVNEFNQKVGDLVKGLSEKYGGTFDRTKFAAVLNLLNFDSNAGYQSGTQYSSDIASEQYWDGRDAAIHTMQQLGINGPNDASIFGYLYVDKTTGKTVVKYSSPIAIMDMTQQWYNQNSINAANIKAIIKNNGVKDAHDSIKKQINNIYNSKSKLSNKDYANIEAIQINWNAQLAKYLAPYISTMTPEAAINNTEVLNLLYPYVEVPGSWEKNNRNRSVSLGDRGNKKKAYYDSWVKSMFSVNDPYKGQY